MSIEIDLVETWPGLLFVGPGLDHSDIHLHADMIERFIRNGEFPVDPVVKYYVQRVRNYAHIVSMYVAEIRHAVVRGDCHEGHWVKIADAASWIKHFRQITHADYEKQVYGRDYGFPPFSLECECRMEGLIEGTADFHRLNSERKHWHWFQGRGGRK